MLNILSLFHYSVHALYPALEILNMNHTPLPIILSLLLNCPPQPIPTGEFCSQSTSTELSLELGTVGLSQIWGIIIEIFFDSSLYVCYHILVHLPFLKLFSLSLPLTKALEVTFYLFFVYVSSQGYFSEQIKWTKQWEWEGENQKKNWNKWSNYIFLQVVISLF